MRKLSVALATALVLASPAIAQQAPANPRPPAPSPNEIVAAAPASDWVAISPADLLVMTLAPDRDGGERQVVIQLMPAPFSEGWVGNIRKLAAAKWWDGLAITRVQDNYVVQWGDPEGEDRAKAKPLPPGLQTMPEGTYVNGRAGFLEKPGLSGGPALKDKLIPRNDISRFHTFFAGFPFQATATPDSVAAWPIHCYGMVGVGRNYSPDTGSGAELYTVIGHAPRHLDRNIALVGRVIEGIEHLSSLPRGSGALGFYEKAEQRVPIISIRLGSDLASSDQPRFQYLSGESASFAKYVDARANRRDPFFITPADGADICNIPVPVRRSKI